jgi:hypothetical protein
MARTKETIAEPGAKTGVTRTFASCGTPVTVTDPCRTTAAEVASRRVSVTLAPSCTISTVARAVTAWSGDETGAAASLIATGTDVRGDTARDIARDTGHIVATKAPLGAGPGSGVP